MNIQHLRYDVERIKSMWNFKEAQCSEIESLYALYTGIYSKIKEFGVTSPDLSAFAQWVSEAEFARGTGYIFTDATNLFMCALISRLNKQTDKVKAFADTACKRLGYDYDTLIKAIRSGDITLLDKEESIEELKARMRQMQDKLNKQEIEMRKRKADLDERERQLDKRERDIRIREQRLIESKRAFEDAAVMRPSTSRRLNVPAIQRQPTVDSYCTHGPIGASPC